MRLIDDKGKQVGIVSVNDAIKLAEERNLDLVEVAPDAKPPVCRILDYGKYKYKINKKQKLAKKKQHKIQVKEIKMRPKIDKHDLDVKIKHIRSFLENGDKVKLTVRFRGRELSHPEYGYEVLNNLIETLKDISNVEVEPKLENRLMQMVLAPKSQKQLKELQKKQKGDENAEDKNS